MTVEVRTIREAEFPEYVKTMFAAAGRPVDPAFVAERRRSTDMAHAIGAFEDGRLVGTFGMRHLSLQLPSGNAVRLAAIGQAGVLPGHALQGHARRMVMHLLTAAKEQGIPIAGATMAEWRGFGHFGWGPSTYAGSYAIETSRAKLRTELLPDAGIRCELVSSSEALAILPALHARSARAGTVAVARDADYWSVVLERLDRGESLDVLEIGARYPAPFFAVYTNGAGEPEGIAIYRIEPKWERGLSRSSLELLYSIHASDTAHTVLWQHLLSLAHVEHVRVPHGPVEHPLTWMLVDGRRLENLGSHDHIWLRILDVPAALAHRGSGMLARAVTVRFTDDVLGEPKTYRLVPDDGRLHVEEEKTTREPEIETSVGTLATLFLGSTRIGPLVAAKKITVRSAAGLAAFASLFASTSSPFVDSEF